MTTQNYEVCECCSCGYTGKMRTEIVGLSGWAWFWITVLIFISFPALLISAPLIICFLIGGGIGILVNLTKKKTIATCPRCKNRLEIEMD